MLRNPMMAIGGVFVVCGCAFAGGLMAATGVASTKAVVGGLFIVATGLAFAALVQFARISVRNSTK